MKKFIAVCAAVLFVGALVAPVIAQVRGREECGYYCDEEHGHIDHNEWLMKRVGKKIAGRLLDGKTWDEYPQERNR